MCDLPFLHLFYYVGAGVVGILAIVVSYFFLFEMLIVGSLHSISFNLWSFRTAKIRSGIKFRWRKDALMIVGLFLKSMAEFTAYRTGQSKYVDPKTDSYWYGWNSWHIGTLRPEHNRGRRATDKQ